MFSESSDVEECSSDDEELRMDDEFLPSKGEGRTSKDQKICLQDEKIHHECLNCGQSRFEDQFVQCGKSFDSLSFF